MPDTVYTSYSLPSGLFKPLPAGYDDKIVSFYLPKGYLAATNPDNSLSSAGAYWKNLPALKSLSGNIIADATLLN